MTPTPEPAQLGYSPRPRLAAISRWKRSLVLLAMVLTIGLLAERYRPKIQRRIEWLYWSHRCAVFMMPGDVERVVEDPAWAKQLLATNRDYVPSAGGAICCPYVYRKLQQLDGRCNWTGDRLFDPAIGFVGTLRRPDGISRLVIVSGEMDDANLLSANLRVLALPRPGVFDSVPGPVGTEAPIYTETAEFIDVHAGVIDPADPSHVRFTCVSQAHTVPEGKPLTCTIDAYLKNDDSLEFHMPSIPRANLPANKVITISGVIPPKYLDGTWDSFGP